MGSRGTETTGTLTVQVVVTAAPANTWQGASARAAQTWTSPYLSTLEYLGLMLTSQFRNTQYSASKVRTTEHELTATFGITYTHPLGLPPIFLLRPSTSRSSTALKTTGSTNVVTKDIFRILCLVSLCIHLSSSRTESATWAHTLPS